MMLLDRLLTQCGAVDHARRAEMVIELSPDGGEKRPDRGCAGEVLPVLRRRRHQVPHRPRETGRYVTGCAVGGGERDNDACREHGGARYLGGSPGEQTCPLARAAIVRGGAVLVAYDRVPLAAPPRSHLHLVTRSHAGLCRIQMNFDTQL
jgi:hypothetical protein